MLVAEVIRPLYAVLSSDRDSLLKGCQFVIVTVQGRLPGSAVFAEKFEPRLWVPLEVGQDEAAQVNELVRQIFVQVGIRIIFVGNPDGIVPTGEPDTGFLSGPVRATSGCASRKRNQFRAIPGCPGGTSLRALLPVAA